VAKKKLRDTKLGGFLKDAAPKLLGIAGDLLPDAGALGMLSRLIGAEPTLNEEQRLEAMSLLSELEVQDRASARSRESFIASLGRFDLMFNLTGVVGLLLFAFIVYAIAFLEVPPENKELWVHLIGISEGIILSIFGYFFGSSIKKNQ
jgi:hypothetical protein